MSAEAPNKPRGGKFARKNFKRKANRAAAEAGIVPGSAEDNDPSKPWYKKPRAGAKDKAAQADKDAEFDPSRVGESKWKMSAAGGGFMVEAPDCPKFEEYYREQGIIAPEEWPAFLAALRTKLPTTFRLSTINGMHYHLLHTLQNELQCTPQENQLGAATSYTYTDGQTKVSSVIDPPTPLAWYPNSLGWYLKAGKSELKTRGNKFAKFRSFLMAQYDQGNLNRQEAVSMIPPLLLDVQPKHMVLDMCAAPGSKTAQLIEGLHGGIHYTDTFATPEGMVIANDADTKRAYLLVHQLKRYGSSAFLVTTHDGQQFPNIYRKDATTTPAGAADAAASSSAAAAAPTSAASSTSAAAAASFNAPSATQGSTLVEFDRILCDVPCSGDGTMRKNINLWSMWDTKFANGLHSLQIQIACRALEMLKVGGLMVYSTCSFNPIENESVVMELLRRCKGNLEIVDVADKLPGLIRRPGLTSWKVRDTGNERWASADDEDIKAGTHKILKGSMFPPSAAEVASAHLERCMRVVPHSQDTGGFFIVLLRKTGETVGIRNPAAYARAMEAAAANGAAAAPTASPDATVVDEADAAAAAAAQSVLAELPDLEDGDAAVLPDSAALPAGLDDPVGSKGHKLAVKSKPAEKAKFNEDPFEPMNATAVSKIIEFYGLSHGVDHSNFFTRSDVHRKCYFVAPGIASLLNCPRNAQRLKIVHTGARCYERGGKPEDSVYPCQYRVVQEGVESILPFMTKQLLYPSFSEALGVLYRHAWAFKDMDREGVHANLYRELTQNKNGCMVFVLRGSEIAKHTTGFSGGSAPVKQEGTAVAAASSASASSSSTEPVTLRSIPICIWKTPHSISLMVSAVEATALIKLLDPSETFMPPEVKAKRDEQVQKDAEKRAERQMKTQEYVNKAREATAAAAAAAAAAASAANVKVEAPSAPAAMDAESSPSPPAAAEAGAASSSEAVKMETS